MAIGSRIRKARQALGITQEMAAGRLGVSTQAVSQWERELTKPSADKIAAIARELGVTTDWLTGHEEADLLPPDHQRPITRAPFIGDLPDEWISNKNFRFSDYANLGIEIYANVVGSAFCIEIDDNSMAPEFREGEIVVFDTGLAPQGGDLVLYVDHRGWNFAQYRGEATLEDNTTILWFVPLSTELFPYQIRPDQGGRIVGTAVEHRRFRRRDPWNRARWG
jgi:transcriptional regulator with XRE-family HTH domain